jgi:hypothetical protein
LICVGYTAKIGAATVPNSTHAPAKLVGSCPFTRPACCAVPAGAKFVPKIVTMAFGESTFTCGLLSPALVIPPVAMDGEFVASSVSENVTLGSPLVSAVIVIGPGLLPVKATVAVTVPSFKVIAGVG